MYVENDPGGEVAHDVEAVALDRLRQPLAPGPNHRGRWRRRDSRRRGELGLGPVRLDGEVPLGGGDLPLVRVAIHGEQVGAEPGHLDILLRPTTLRRIFRDVTKIVPRLVAAVPAGSPGSVDDVRQILPPLVPEQSHHLAGRPPLGAVVLDVPDAVERGPPPERGLGDGNEVTHENPSVQGEWSPGARRARVTRAWGARHR